MGAGHPAFVGAQKHPVPVLQGDQGKAPFSRGVPAAAVVDALGVQGVFNEPGLHPFPADPQVGGPDPVFLGVDAGVHALAPGVHLPPGEVLVHHVVAHGQNGQIFPVHQYATFHM